MRIYWRPFFGSLLFLLTACGAASRGLGRGAATNPQLNEVAHWLEAEDLTSLYERVSYSDWTKSVLQGLSVKERKRLAKVLRKKKSRSIREAHLEQYRVSWCSREQPDSEFIVTFLMSARPNDMSLPIIAFSSRVDNIPALLADALEKNKMPLVLSFYQPLSSWVETLPKLSLHNRKNRAGFYRSLKLVEKRTEERLYKGQYVAPNGLLVQDELKCRLYRDGRWLVE